MAIIDPTSALILGTSYLAKEVVADAAKRMLGPSWDVVGERIKLRLFGPNVGAVIGAAAAVVIEAGHEPQPVPGRILMPLLEHSSWEEEFDLNKMWVALLANAASPSSANMVLPAYIEILRQLAPIQARFIEVVWEYQIRNNGSAVPAGIVKGGADPEKPLSSLQYDILASDLHRLGVIDAIHWLPLESEDEKRKAPHTANGYRQISDASYEAVLVSTLGAAFRKACTSPIQKA